MRSGQEIPRRITVYTTTTAAAVSSVLKIERVGGTAREGAQVNQPAVCCLLGRADFLRAYHADSYAPKTETIGRTQDTGRRERFL